FSSLLRLRLAFTIARHDWVRGSAGALMATPHTVGIILFNEFEVLDVFGPAEAFGSAHLSHVFRVMTVAEKSGAVRSAQGLTVLADYSFSDCLELDLLLVPGGIGTRREVNNRTLLAFLSARGATAEFVTSVCTGAALLARTGMLDRRRATTNKRSYDWVTTQGPAVRWVPQARWVEDGRFVTSSGVSAGIDMALALIARIESQDAAEAVAVAMEYEWHRDSDWDPFAKIWSRV
ncbi:MAG: DJ-1/PfpI family protein, partial [Candidatus Binataceae bacterium]